MQNPANTSRENEHDYSEKLLQIALLPTSAY